MRVIFKWDDAEGRRMSSPRELDGLPRVGDWVSPDHDVELMAVDVRWFVHPNAEPMVLVYLEKRDD